MSTVSRELRVIADRCLGCQACSAVCPEGLIVRADEGLRRRLSFAVTCDHDCRLCVTACPVDALELQGPTEASPGGVTGLGFDLVVCNSCGLPVATQEMLAWLRATIPPQVQTDAWGEAWLGLCPSCRQQVEAERVAAEGLLSRWL